MIRKRIIEPTMVNDDYKTIVTIEPTFVNDYMSNTDYYFPEAYVKVDFYVNGGKYLSRTTFRKILDDTPYHCECDFVTRVADEMVNGDLDAIGLGGLSTIDIYKAMSLSCKPEDLDTEKMKAILYSSLRIPYYDPDNHISHSVNQTKDGFYDLEVQLFRIR